jgi:hypothetical protein
MKVKEETYITTQPSGSLNTEDRLALARLLTKAGYIVSLEKRKVGTRTEYAVVGYVKEDT